MATNGIKTFLGNNLEELEGEVNDYVKNRDLEIISIQRDAETAGDYFKYILTLIYRTKEPPECLMDI